VHFYTLRQYESNTFLFSVTTDICRYVVEFFNIPSVGGEKADRTPPKASRPMRVLVALSGITFAKTLEGLLAEWGFQPVVVGDPQSLSEALQKPEAPPLAIIEWSTPHAELCRRHKEAGGRTPAHVIVLSAPGENQNGVEGLDIGTYDFLSKPWDQDKLKARIRVAERIVRLQTALDRSREALAQAAMQDAATGALNRRAILEVLHKEFARSRRTGPGFSIGLIESDQLVQIIAANGPQVGEEVLRALTRCLQSNLRVYDWIGQYGDGVFLVIAPGSTGTREEGVYERLCNNIGLEPVFTAGGLIVVSVSIGVAASAAHASSDALVAAARKALDQATSAGRNCVAYAES
jgi:two-component system, cell cycle response regulator